MLSKRPILALAAALFTVSVLLAFLSAAAAYIGAAMLIAVFIIIGIRGERKAFVIAAVIVLAVCNIVYCSYRADAIKANNNTAVDISGIVGDISFLDKNTAEYTVNVDSGELKGERLQIYSGALSCGIGDRLAGKCSIQLIEGEWAFSFRAEGIYAKGIPQGQIDTQSGDGMLKAAENIRVAVTNIMFENLSYESAAAITGIVVGNDFYLGDELKTNIRNSGVSHIMVVSGMHMALICGSVYSLFKRTGLNRNISAIIILAVTLLLMLICGFTPSVIRAGFAYIMMVVGTLLGRKSDGTVSLSAAISIMVLYNPYIAGSIGFMLSCAATLGILVIYPEVAERINIKNKILASLVDVGLLTLSSLVATLPVAFIFFNMLPNSALITNILISHAVNAVMVMACIAAVLYYLPFGEYICKLPFFFVDMITRFFLNVIKFFG